MRRWPRPLLVAAVAAVAITAAGPVARADVDPASDVLLLQDVFVPYHPKVCSEAANSLRDLTKETKKAGYPVRVAIIGSRKDLGGAPQLFNKPKAYAIFLGSELGVYGGRDYTRKLALLVVMPAGVALARSPTAAEARNPPPLPPEIMENFSPSVTPIGEIPPALKGVTVPPNADNNELARVAMTAIPRLAKAAGHPIKAGAVVSGKCSSGGGISSTVLIFGAPILLLILGMVGFTGFQRRRGRSAGE